MTKPDAILFDLDGTLWDSTKGIYDALMSLEDEFPERTPPITKEKLDSCMGLPMDEISKRLFPTASEEEREEIMNRFTQRELSHLLRVGGKLYPCIESVLNDLSRDFPLFIVSNCQQGYIETFLEHHQFSKYFTDFLSWGDTKRPKGENLQLMAEKHQLHFPVYVGDTKSDETAARQAGMKFIYLSYGFGEAISPDLTLENLCDIRRHLKELSWD
ncbi:MAG: HAD family hydrolase [Tissierellia bacterium]|nr:HAD family hydrolase [Bacillota bacterium]NLL22323.1 HAD family hydrolase [Tissierellia bacterium]